MCRSYRTAALVRCLYGTAVSGDDAVLASDRRMTRSSKLCARLAFLLGELGILSSEFDEPMSCDEKILRQFVHGKMVFDEHFIVSGNYDFNDERFEKVLKRIETGFKDYVDSSCFIQTHPRKNSPGVRYYRIKEEK